MPLLTRRAQVACLSESVEGTAESLTASEAKMLAYSPNFTPNIGRFNRDPARASLGKLAAVVGNQLASLTWRTELKGSGAVGTAPAWNDALIACGFQRSVVKTIAIGAIASGPFVPMETITGGTSAATGRVVGEITNGATVVHCVLLSGTFQSGEVLTGGTSGATATTSGTAQDNKGFEYITDSTTPASATTALYADGTRNLLVGSRGNVSISATGGEPVFLEFDFQGVYGGTTDTALLVPTYEVGKPPAFLNVGFSIHGLSVPFSTLNIDLGNTLQPRLSANAEKGALSVFLTDRNPTGACDPEHQVAATHDFYGKLTSAASARLYFALSGSAGSKVCVALPQVEYSAVARQERGGIVVAGVSFEAKEASVNSSDSDVQIAMI